MDEQDKQLWDLLGKAERHRAPEHFVSSVMRQIQQEQHQTSPTKHQEFIHSFLAGLKGMLTPSKLAWTSATGVALAICILLMTSHHPDSQPSTLLAMDDTLPDEELLLDIACSSLGEESLQNALFELASTNVDSLGETELAEIILASY